MFFKNLLTYRLTNNIDFSDLEELLKTKPAKPCNNQEMATYGFTPPYGKTDAPLVYSGQDFHLIAARKEERILPSDVIKKELQAKVAEIEDKESRKVFRGERTQLKDEIIQTLLPRAFTKHKDTYAIIAPSLGLIFVDANNANKAEELLSLLRECTGSLPVIPLSTNERPSIVLTSWVNKQQASNGFNILEECSLQGLDGQLIKAKNHDLTTEEILIHLKAGLIVTQLALDYQDKLHFLVDDSLAIKRIKFDDVLLEQADQEGGDDAVTQFDASLAIMVGTLNELIPSLLNAFGGESTPR